MRRRGRKARRKQAFKPRVREKEGFEEPRSILPIGFDEWQECRAIWIAVIIEAGKELTKRNTQLVTEVLEWIRTPDFEEVCDLAGMSAENVSKFYDKLRTGQLHINHSSFKERK